MPIALGVTKLKTGLNKVMGRNLIQVSALGVGLPSGAPFACKHRLKHRNRAPGQQGLRAGTNLLGRNLDGNQIARKYRTCAGHADLLFRDGGKRQAGKCDCLLEFTSRPELSLRAAHESGHNSMCQNGLKVLLRVTVRTQKRDSSAISSGVAALKKRGEHARKRLSRFAGKIGTIGSIARLGRRSP